MTPLSMDKENIPDSELRWGFLGLCSERTSQAPFESSSRVCRMTKRGDLGLPVPAGASTRRPVGPSTWAGTLRRGMRRTAIGGSAGSRDRPTGEDNGIRDSETATSLVPRRLPVPLAWPRHGLEHRRGAALLGPRLASRTKRGSLALRSVGGAPTLLPLSSVMSNPWARAAEVAGAQAPRPPKGPRRRLQDVPPERRTHVPFKRAWDVRRDRTPPASQSRTSAQTSAQTSARLATRRARKAWCLAVTERSARDGKITGKRLNAWKLHSLLLNNSWIK